MSSGGVAQERFLTSRGDNGVLPAGITVMSCPSGNCQGGRGIVFPDEAVSGMFVFYKNSDFLSLDPSATPITGKVIFGMFNSSKGNGRVDEIIKMAGEYIECDNIKSLSAGPAVPGQEETGYYKFLCSESEKLYQLIADFESDRTHKEFYKNRKGRVSIQYSRPADSCTTCDDPATCLEISRGLVTNFEQKRTGVLDGDNPLWIPQTRTEPLPFDLFVFHPANYHFCLDGVANGCGDCTSFTGIKGIRIAGVDFTFNGLYNSTSSNRDQIKEFISLINCVFDTYEGGDHEGFAWKAAGAVDGACESLRVTINSRHTVDALIKYDGTYLEPCDTEFFDLDGYCAIGYVGHLAEENCECETPSDNLVKYYPTHVNIAGDGFVDGSFHILQKARIPQNTGIQIWQAEYETEVRPEFYEGDAQTGGRYNNLLGNSRSKHVLALCDKNYCFISMVNTKEGQRSGAIGFNSRYTTRTNIALEMSASATKTALIADLNAIKAISNLDSADISCETVSYVAPTPSPSRTPDATPSVTPTITPTNTVSKTPSTTPSITISKTPSVTPTVSPSA